MRDIAIFSLGTNRIDFSKIRMLRANLGRHLGESPCFIIMDKEAMENWQERKENSDMRVFTAWRGEELTVYLEVTDEGENFVTEVFQMQNICGAYCIPQYRGRGVALRLLNYAMEILNVEGYTYLGVDFESINPTAWGFWTKYFEPYTYSLTRRIVKSAFKDG